jgi:hypothetical protein
MAKTLMRGSPDGTIEPDRHRQETLDLAAYLRSASEQLSQFSREARLHRAKKSRVLHPIPGL